jgi:uncharacterized RmlC-like cupin family protein
MQLPGYDHHHAVKERPMNAIQEQELIFDMECAYQAEVERARERTQGGKSKGGVVAMQGGESIEAKQGIPCFVGVSERISGSYGLSMQTVIIPPGGQCNPHSHIGAETALYIISGNAETYYGPGLTQRTVSGPGDFLYIAPGVPHCAYNLSETEPVVAVTARTDANDQERIDPYDVDAYYRRNAA